MFQAPSPARRRVPVRLKRLPAWFDRNHRVCRGLREFGPTICPPVGPVSGPVLLANGAWVWYHNREWMGWSRGRG